MKFTKPTNQEKLNNAKNVEKSNSSKTSRYLVLREQVARILANIVQTR
tara:strand:+ start:1341 stop:1484 length:144 start_codon:yes stop_codon:yes gene_type:complete